MPRKVELTIAHDYVPSWTVTDAIRELFQNALDQEVQNPENKMSWKYEDETLTLCNKHSSLTMQSLLLGCSTKQGDNATIGQFGEGYKVAALVLLRHGRPMTIYNYAEREIWKPRFVDSKRFGTKILTFFIEKVAIWDKIPDNDLTIEISNITRPEWHSNIEPSNLHVQLPCNIAIKASNKYGEALSSDEHKGLIFVNGLYVCKYDAYKYGYNFKPGFLKLDRDRKLVSDFDLKWLASRFWCEENDDTVMKLVEEGSVDTCYVADMMSSTHHNLSDACYTKFRKVYGPHAVPVTTQEEAEKVPAGYRSVIVSNGYRSFITRSILYEEPQKGTQPSPLDRLQNLWDTYGHLWPTDAQGLFEDIMKELRE